MNQNLTHNIVVNKLAQKLFDVFEDNIVYSPLSITYILSLLHHGAVENTDHQFNNLITTKHSIETLTLMSKLFNSDIVKLTNMLIINQKFIVRQEYLDMLHDLALVSNEDFKKANLVVKKANLFIEKNTNGLIKDIVKEEMIVDESIMILINTLYFKAKWNNPFKAINSYQEKFNNKSIITMMKNTKSYPYFEDKDVQIVELPYDKNEFCMGFILPKVNDRLDLCNKYLDNNDKYPLTYVNVHIPKFTQRKNIDLIPYLKELGLTDIFCNKSRMDNMILSSNAQISKMIHEAVVIVDENGTEAAAITVAMMTKECCFIQPTPKLFIACHSFVYYIKHIATNILLFVGDYHGDL